MAAVLAAAVLPAPAGAACLDSSGVLPVGQEASGTFHVFYETESYIASTAGHEGSLGSTGMVVSKPNFGDIDFWTRGFTGESPMPVVTTVADSITKIEEKMQGISTGLQGAIRFVKVSKAQCDNTAATQKVHHTANRVDYISVNNLNSKCLRFRYTGRKGGSSYGRRWLGSAPKCVDTPHWNNGMHRRTCGDYAQHWCDADVDPESNNQGQVRAGNTWATGATWNYPERHCCACGKPLEPGHQIDLGEHWQDYGRINHELAHFLGFKHEQQRPDRDSYITLPSDATVAKMPNDFNKPEIACSTYSTAFDYASISLYWDKPGNPDEGVGRRNTPRFVEQRKPKHDWATGMSTGDKYGMLRHLAKRKNVWRATRLAQGILKSHRRDVTCEAANMPWSFTWGSTEGESRHWKSVTWTTPATAQTCKGFGVLVGDGVCTDQQKQGQRAHRYVPGGTGIEWLQQECQADSKCMAVAYNPNPQRDSILYTTTGCTHYCTSTEWQTDPALITTVASYAPYQCWKRNDKVTSDLAEAAERQRQEARKVEEERQRVLALRCPKGQYRIGTTGYVCKQCSHMNCGSGTTRIGTCSDFNNGYSCKTQNRNGDVNSNGYSSEGWA
jgi:hypothetical protein